MGVIVEGSHKVYLGAACSIVEEDRELAWAEKHVTRNPALKYLLGRFVEANTANDNGHIFDLKELETAQSLIPNGPLNMLHRPHYIVGNFIATELVYPTEATAGGEELNPYVDALAGFYRYYFPEEYQTIEKAHKDGSLFFSMECVPKSVTCAAICGQTYDYDGRQSPSYCAHLNAPAAKKRLNQPHFTGGALIIPPAKPGWKRADITQLSGLMSNEIKEAEIAQANEQIAREFPHLGSRSWEAMMAGLLGMAYADIEGAEYARNFSTEKRKQMAKEGTALPDGSYPIDSPQDLANAIKAYGRANPADRGKVKAHITKMARALGKTDLLPDDWND